MRSLSRALLLCAAALVLLGGATASAHRTSSSQQTISAKRWQTPRGVVFEHRTLTGHGFGRGWGGSYERTVVAPDGTRKGVHVDYFLDLGRVTSHGTLRKHKTSYPILHAP